MLISCTETKALWKKKLFSSCSPITSSPGHSDYLYPRITQEVLVDDSSIPHMMVHGKKISEHYPPGNTMSVKQMGNIICVQTRGHDLPNEAKSTLQNLTKSIMKYYTPVHRLSVII